MKFKIYSFGCKANQYDGQNIREKLIAEGMSEAGERQKADICIVNSCAVTAKAEKESLYQLRRFRRENPGAKVMLTGCVAVVRGKAGGADRLLSKPRKESISFFKGHTRAFLKIQDGCDNCCAFCTVPLARGRPHSKPLKAVAAEARALAKHGHKEIVLTGICLGKYGKGLAGSPDLVDAVEAIERIPGVSRIRLSSIEAVDVDARLIAKLAEGGKLCPHLHVPLQSGDDGVLKSMNRPYTAARFAKLIRTVKTAVPDFSLTTDVMAGFPGETEAAFRNTLKLVKAVQPLKVHIFPFSPRPGTRAASMAQDASADEVRARVKRLEEAGRACREAFRRRFAGRRMEVLIEGRSKSVPGCWQGYTSNYLEVMLKSKSARTNTLHTIRIS
jgi:threonylcarbamoyladenosine tRNA methylthiotransferase MtaB